jgi:type IV secretion system protein VirD4
MSAGRTAAKVVFAAVAMAGLAVAALYLTAFLFLVINKTNPAKARPFSVVHYWKLYSDDTTQRKRLVGAGSVSGILCLVVVPLMAVVGARRGRELHGSARFATMSEVSAAGLMGSHGIIVGKLAKAFLVLPGQLFVLLAAPTRSGKDVGIVIPNMLHYPGSVVVNDIKGELFEKTAGFRNKCGQAVFRFAPFNEQGRSHRYNPLGYVRNDPRYRVADLLSIGQVLYPNDGQATGSEGFFNDQARNLFLALGLYLLDTPGLPRTIGQLLRVSSSVGVPLKDYLQRLMAERQQSDKRLEPDTLEALSRFLSNPDNTLGSILSTFNAPLTVFADPLVDAAMSANDFLLTDLRRRPMSVYIEIPAKRLRDARLLLNLLFTQVVYLNTDELPEKNPELKVECLLVMNEFTALGRVSILADSIGYIAGYGLRMLTVIQSMSQLAGVYGDKQARNFATNHALRILYAPQEQADAKEYSEMLGTLTEKSQSRSRNVSHGSRGGGSSQGTSTSDQRRMLMLPQELRELGADREIVMYEKCKPVLADKIRYYEDPVFTSRLLAPPQIPPLDWRVHRARAEGRVRLITEDEAGSVDLRRLTHSVADLPAISNDASDDEISRFVEAYFARLETAPLPTAADSDSGELTHSTSIDPGTAQAERI